MARRYIWWSSALLCVLTIASTAHGGGQAPNPRTGVELTGLIARAEAGDADAQFDLGWKHYEGNGAPKDYEQSVRWLRRAANQGHHGAQVRLGNLYEWGHGVPEDPRIAASWYQKAADGGLAQAQFALGKLYLDGNGVSKDATKAVAAFRRAAESGFPMAAFVLGSLHRSGEGVRQDNVDAYAWFLVATASQAIPPFVLSVRDEVAATLTPDERARAERLAAGRRPRGGELSASTVQATSRGTESPGLSGQWALNSELSSAMTDPSSDVLGGGRGGFGGGRGGGFGRGGGRGGFGGQRGGGGSRPSEEEMQQQRALMREVLILPTRFTLVQSGASITMTEPNGATRTYQTNGKREKHQLTSGVVETKTEWADGSLVMELKSGRRTITRTFTPRNTSERRRLEVSTTVEGAPKGARRLVVYDEQPAIP